MVKLRLAFRRDAPFDRLVVSASTEKTAASFAPKYTSETIYEHEDHFLRRLIAADIDPGMTDELIAAVLLAVGRSDRPGKWVQITVTEEQVNVLGINLRPATDLPAGLPFSFHQNAHQFHDFLMNSPTPFVVLSGPEYVCTFINPPYVRLVGRTSAEQLLGRRLLDALPELAGQPCLQWLNTTYRTGVIQHRVEMKYIVHEDDTGLDVEVYFDIVYSAVRDASDRVMGVMAQATDVTERVLARQVTEHREQELYRLWSEIQTIYSSVPVGIAVIGAGDRKLVRLNQMLAGLLGAPPEDLVGRTVMDLPFAPRELARLVERAATGTRVVGRVDEGIGGEQAWDIDPVPVLGAHGEVATITLVAHAVAATGESQTVFATA